MAKNKKSGKKEEQVRSLDLWSWSIFTLIVGCIVGVATYWYFIYHLEGMSTDGRVPLKLIPQTLLMMILFVVSVIFVSVFWRESRENAQDRRELRYLLKIFEFTEKLRNHIVSMGMDCVVEEVNSFESCAIVFNSAIKGGRELKKSLDDNALKSKIAFDHQLAEANAKIADLCSERDRLRTTHEAELCKRAAAAQEQLVTVNKQHAQHCATVQAEVTALRLQLEQANNLKQSTVTSARDEMDRLRGLIEDMEGQRDLLLSDLATLRKELFLANDELEQGTENFRSLREQVLSLGTEVIELTERLSHQTEFLENEEAMRLQAEDAQDVLERKLAAANNELSGLYSRVTLLQSEITCRCQQDDELRKLKWKLDFATSQIDQSAAEISDLRASLGSTVEERNTFMHELTALKAKKQTAPKGMREVRVADCAKCREHQRTIGEYRQLIAEVRSRVAELIPAVVDMIEYFKPASDMNAANFTLASARTVLNTLLSELRAMEG
jgi:chromosome segregation ATPase